MVKTAVPDEVDNKTNANDTDDADLARAIAESLRDIAPPATSCYLFLFAVLAAHLLIYVENERQEDATPAPASRTTGAKSISKSHTTDITNANTNANAPGPPPTAGIPTAGGGAPSFLTDHAEMERERLAQQKRVRPASPVVARLASSDDDEYDEEAGDGEEGSEGSARKRARLDARGDASGGGGASGTGTGAGAGGNRGGNKGAGASASASGSTPDDRRLFLV
ncbi:hypothetical protein C8F04DRAFT_1279730 [Mycena alexandri]|uniref:Uncharacterized protein n=1 Tax=Mycena alexandri TaxID=1745969 RepID=A0AAD6S1Q2_9AGAR|nr:hypothetical protein C8F04DRAFT_1279730 [Mycena alexandri]